MTTAIVLAIVLAVCAVLYFARKGGQDATTAKSATETLQDVAKANRPTDPAERELLQSKYRRD